MSESGYNSTPITALKPARCIKRNDVLFLGGAGERIVASDPWRHMGYIVFETQWIDGQSVGRWMVRDDSEVRYLIGARSVRTEN